MSVRECRARFRLLPVIAAGAVLVAVDVGGQDAGGGEPPPIKALLVSGGVSHDYATRTKILVQGIRERLVRKIEWVVRLEAVGESDARIPLFASPQWAEGYDIVVHDHCFPRVKDPVYVDRVLAPHRAGVPAVMLHGTMMSFRTGDDRWFDFTGVTTRAHEPARPLRVEPLPAGGAIAADFQFPALPGEELYRVEKSAPGLVGLARVFDPAGQAHVAAWTHRYGPAQTRVFGTTLANASSNLAQAKYLDLVAKCFLWALGDEGGIGFRVVAETDSLAGMEVPPAPGPLPRPGRNAAREGRVSAFSWGREATAEEVAWTNDGDMETAWMAESGSPGAWEVEWDEPRELASILLAWEGAAPSESLLEVTRDGRSWEPIGRPAAGAGGLDLVQIQPAPYKGVRLTVASLPNGNGWGLRDVAIYHAESAVPAAILASLPPQAAGAPPRLRSAGSDGFPARIQLAPGWRLGAVEEVSIPGEVAQIVPAGGGSVFLSSFPGAAAPGTVFRCFPSAQGGFELQTYLSPIEPATRIAWDGEWLHTLSGPALKRVRRALGPGPADERQELGLVWSSSGEGGPEGAVIHDLFIGDDGWLRARVSSEVAGFVLSREGRRVAWPLDGILRFSREGAGLSSERPLSASPPRELPGGGIADGVLRRADDGRVVWLWGEGGGRRSLVSVVPDEDPDEGFRDWNETASAELDEFLQSAGGALRPSQAREAALERQRRKVVFERDLDRIDGAAGLQADAATRWIAAIAGKGDRASLETLLQLAGGSEPSLQAAAFSAIGDHPAAEAPLFIALGDVTIPRVSASIFDALRRSGLNLPGAETVATGLIDHEDDRLSGAARDFLIARTAVGPVFAGLDRGDPGLRSAALSVLGGMPVDESVDGLIKRLEERPDPAFRREGLATLASLYPAKSRTPRTWERSGSIAEFLAGRIGDRRVDQAALLEAMATHSVPGPSAGDLVALGRGDLRLETYAVEGLLARPDESLPAGAVEWLLGMADDDSRDPGLRQKAAALIAGRGPSEDYPRWFSLTGRHLGTAPGSDSERLLREAWVHRADHGEHHDWLAERTRGSDDRLRALAWMGLMASWPVADSIARGRLASGLAAAFRESGDAGSAFHAGMREMPVSAVDDFLRRIAGDPDAAAREVAETLASLHSRDPLTGGPLPPVAAADAGELTRVAGDGKGSVGAGADLFRTKGCLECHNPHGEGPSSAPDLALASQVRPISELVIDVARPADRITEGYELVELQRPGAPAWIVFAEARSGEAKEWIDLAGNRFSLSEADQVMGKGEGRGAAVPGSPCGPLTPLSRKELADLVAFVLSLGR